MNQEVKQKIEESNKKEISEINTDVNKILLLMEGKTMAQAINLLSTVKRIIEMDFVIYDPQTVL